MKTILLITFLSLTGILLGNSPNYSDKIDLRFEEHNIDKSPGYGVVILNNNKVEYLKGFGMADIKKDKYLDEKTTFLSNIYYEAGVIVFLQLVEKGILKLDAPVIKYLPELSNLYDETLTLEFLIQLRSGMPRFYRKENKKDYWSSQDILELYSNWDNIKYKPGERVLEELSKPTAALMNLILIRATGKSLSKHIEEDLFTSAEISNSGFITDNEKPDLILYGRKKNGYVTKKNSFSNIEGYSDIYTTIVDYTKFHETIDKGEFLSKDSMEYYYSPYMPDTRNKYKNFYDGYFSLSGYICDYHTLGYRIYFTGGGFSAGAYIPDLNIRVFMISNYYKDDVSYKVFNSILPILGVL